MDANFYYTTLTTIVAALAGMIAFWIAFFIFKMGRLNDLIDITMETLAEPIKNEIKPETGFPDGEFTNERKILNYMKKVYPNDRRVRFLNIRVSLKELIYSYFDSVLIMNCTSLLFSLLLIPFGMSLNNLRNIEFLSIAFGINFGLGSASILMTIYSVFKISMDPKSKIS